MKRVLITGASGWIGALVVHELAPHFEVVAAYHRKPPEQPGIRRLVVDIVDEQAVMKLVEEVQPDVIVHTAAMTSADSCERRPELAAAVNEMGTRWLALAAKRHDALLVYTSTDYLFEGVGSFWREEDVPAPTSVYGRTKLDGERWVRELAPRRLILRLALCYGKGYPEPRGFTDFMVRQLTAGEPVTVFTDQYRTPLYAGDIPRLLHLLLANRLEGLYHVAGPDRLSRYEFAALLCRSFGLDNSMLLPCKVADFPSSTPRPVDCSLATDKLTNLTGFRFSSVQEGLQFLLEEYADDAAVRSLPR